MLTRSCFLLAICLVAASVVAAEPPAPLAPFFQPPTEFAKDFGTYRSPLKFDDGTPVQNAEDWKRRRAEIRNYWHAAMGP